MQDLVLFSFVSPVTDSKLRLNKGFHIESRGCENRVTTATVIMAPWWF